MDANLINPFINSAVNVLKTMAQTDPIAGQPFVKSGNATWGFVTGIIGMAGENVTGNMIISFDSECILSIVSKMLFEEFKEINKDVTDAVGEITNMIVGGTKTSLAEQGYVLNMATPLVVTGKDVELSQLGKTPIITIPFSTDNGKFVIEASIARK